MIVLITGASHTGKTLMAQRLLEKYHWPYLSLDHLKMGFIRSGYTNLSVEDDNKITGLLWPVVKEMMKTAVENEQNLIIEGCYIPFDWKKDFSQFYLDNIKDYCLVMSENYIRSHIVDIERYGNVIEKRLDNTCEIERILSENNNFQEQAKKFEWNIIRMDNEYKINLDIKK